MPFECYLCLAIIIGIVVITYLIDSNSEKKGRIDVLISNINNQRSYFDYNLNNGDICFISIDGLENYRNNTIKYNNELKSLDSSKDQSSTIRYMNDVITKVNMIHNKFNSYSTSSVMLGYYGGASSSFLQSVQRINQAGADQYINRCHHVMDSKDLNGIYQLDLNFILRCIWFYAMEKPFSVYRFNEAVRAFNRLTKPCNDPLLGGYYKHVDIQLASFYSKMQVGGEQVLMQAVQEFLRTRGSHNVTNSAGLAQLASLCMWMRAYSTEKMVLQFMVLNGYSMTAQLQNRLNNLNRY